MGLTTKITAEPDFQASSLNIKNPGLVTQVSESLALAILDGTLKGGQQLIEIKLQQQFGISRTPVREAFRDLEKKGLVVLVPRKGAFVRKVTLIDIEENFPIRATLEGLAARSACRRMKSHELKAMDKALARMKKAAAAKDARTFREHHLEYHEIFIKASGNSLLISLLENLRLHSLWHRFCYKYYQEDFQKSLAVHQKISDLFHQKEIDEQEIEETVRRHIEVARDKFLEYLSEQDSR